MDIATPRHRRGDSSHLSFHSAAASLDFGTSSILLKEIAQPHSITNNNNDGEATVTTRTTHNPDYAVSWEPDAAKRILAQAAAVRGQRPYMVALVGEYYYVHCYAGFCFMCQLL